MVRRLTEAYPTDGGTQTTMTGEVAYNAGEWQHDSRGHKDPAALPLVDRGNTVSPSEGWFR